LGSTLEHLIDPFPPEFRAGLEAEPCEDLAKACLADPSQAWAASAKHGAAKAVASAGQPSALAASVAAEAMYPVTPPKPANPKPVPPAGNPAGALKGKAPDMA
jgi:hypothetical protein